MRFFGPAIDDENRPRSENALQSHVRRGRPPIKPKEERRPRRGPSAHSGRTDSAVTSKVLAFRHSSSLKPLSLIGSVGCVRNQSSLISEFVRVRIASTFDSLIHTLTAFSKASCNVSDLLGTASLFAFLRSCEVSRNCLFRFRPSFTMDRGNRDRVDASDPEQIRQRREEQVERLSSQIRNQETQKTPSTQVLSGTIYICGGS